MSTLKLCRGVALAVMLCFIASANAAIVPVTVNFGTDGTSGFVAVSGGSASLSSTFSGVVTLTATPSAGSLIYNNGISNPVGSDGIGLAPSGTADTATGTQIDVNTEVLTLSFTGTAASSVIITNVILTNIQDSIGNEDGAVITRTAPTLTTLLEDNGSGTSVGTAATCVGCVGQSYNAANLNYSTGVVSWAGTAFTFATKDGNDDYYLKSITFQYNDGIPEPATYALFGAGLIALAAVRHFRARRG